MRVAIIADGHFDQGSRFEECVRIHDWIAEDIARRDVDLVLHAGDVYERKSTPREREAVAAWVQRITQQAPLVIVRGNHDALGDLKLLERLDTHYPVAVEEAAGVRYVETADGTDAAVACLAWPQKSRVLSHLSAAGIEAGELAAGDAMRAVLRGMGAEMAGFSGPRILLTHAMVRGSVTSHGQPLVGCDLELSLEDLALADADFVAMGHIHMGQDWRVSRGEAVYPGSPRRTAFGEIEEKGYVIVDFDDDPGALHWHRVQTPCARMWLFEGSYADGAITWDDVECVRDGDEVRLRYRVSADWRGHARAIAQDVAEAVRARGATVKLEEVVEATARARAPEVAAARTLEAKLRAYWAARDDVPEEGRDEVLITMAHQAEEEVRDAS